MGALRPLLAVVVAFLVVVAYTPVAAAQAPPDSEFDQYVPDVPEADQDTPIRDKKDRGGSNGRGSVPAPAAGELEGQGSAGGAAAAAAEATSPDDDADDSQKRKKRRGADGGGSVPQGDGSSVAALAGVASGSDSEGGMGILLPLIVVGAIGAGVAYVVVRRRIAGGDSARAGGE